MLKTTARIRFLIATLLFTMTTNAQAEIKPVAYKGWKNKLQISNGTVELIVALDVGPRMMRYGFVGGENLFTEFPEQMGKTSGHFADSGSNFETFSNQDFLEIETLGPLQRIAPGKSVEHTERWWLLKGVSSDLSDAGIERNIKPMVENIIK